MAGFGGALASADDGDDADREGKREDEDVCRQRGSRGRSGEPGRALGLCLDSGRVGTPAGRRDSTGRGGSGRAGNTVEGAGEEERRKMRQRWREGDTWPPSGSL